MQTRIWLKVEATELFQISVGGRRTLRSVPVESEDDRAYINAGNIINPTTVLPSVDPELIERWTCRDEYRTGFRTDGLYELEAAKGHVEMLGYGESRFQRVSITAPTADALRELYLKIRTGTLAPYSDWGDTQVAPAEDEATST